MKLIPELALAKIEQVLNQALSQDLAWQNNQKPLIGHTVLFVLNTVDLAVLAQCEPTWITLSFVDQHTPADLIITATPKACMQALRDKAIPRSIHIAGDALLAQHMQTAMFESHIDWEAVLALHVGDVPAQWMRHTAQLAAGFFSRLKRDLLADTHDYLVQESALVITPAEQQSFIDKVTELRYATDRLEAKIKMRGA